jgi:competence protein ComGC
MNILLVILIIIILYLLFIPNTCENFTIPRGTYKDTCKDITEGNTKVYATCLDKSQNYKKTSAGKKCLCMVNDNGSLKCIPNTICGSP